MRILVVSTSFPLHHSSMSGIFVKKLTDHLSDKHQIEVLTPYDKRNKNPSPRTCYPVSFFSYAPHQWSVLAHHTGGIPVAIKNQPLALLLVPFFLGAMLLKTFVLARKHNILHANWAVCGLIAGLVSKLLKKKSVVTLRGSDVSDRSSLISTFFVFSCLKLCDKVVTVSQGMATTLTNRWPEFGPKITHIPNGIDEIYYTLPLTFTGSNMSNAICIGNLVPNKSVSTIIRAMASVRPQCLLSVVGHGSERDCLHNLSKELELEDRVNFIGLRPSEEIPELLSQHHIFILASYSEGRSNALLEAMAAGRIIIASDIEPNKELIKNGQNGLLFKPGNSEQLAQQISKVITNPELAVKLATEARNTVKDLELSWQAAANSYSSIYESLYSDNASTGRH